MSVIVVVLMAVFATWAVKRNLRRRALPGPEEAARPVDPAFVSPPHAHEDGRDAEALKERKTRLERELDELETQKGKLRSELLSVNNRLDEPGDGPPHR